MKCDRCWWSEGGRCYNDAIADILKCDYGLKGELFEGNDDLLERCRLAMDNKQEIKSLRREQSVIEEQIKILEAKSFLKVKE